MENLEEKTCYGLLMSRVLLGFNIYIFKPIQVVEGFVKEIGGSEMFIDKIGSTYLLSNNAQALSCDDELSVYHIIEEEKLLEMYPDSSIFESIDEYFSDITQTVTFGFLNEEFDKLYMMNYDLKDIIEIVNSGVLFENLNNVNYKQQEKQLLHNMMDENTQTTDVNEAVYITKNAFKQLLDIEDYQLLRETLQSIYEHIGDTYVDEFEDEDDTKEDEKINLVMRKGSDLIELFNKSYNFILKVDDIEEIKDIISQLIDMYESLFNDFDLRQESDRNEACKDFIINLIDKYEQMLKLDNLEEIKSRITDIRKTEEGNIKQVAETYEMPAYDIVEEPQNEINDNLLDVRDMKDFLDKKIIGQEQAKRAVISAIFMNGLSDDKRDRNACLLVGPTGSGKTLIAETLSEYLGIPMAIYDTTQLTAPGYIGANLEDCLALLLAATKGNIKEAEKGIVVFDEIDKKGSSSNDDISGRAVLNNLLPFIQGTTYTVKYNNRNVQFDTSNLTIFATGAFTEAVKDKTKDKSCMGFAGSLIESKEDIVYPKLTIEDLSKYGNVPIELLGRFSTITQLHGHTKESLRKIILDCESSALIHEKHKLAKIKIDLSWTEDFIDAVIDKALELKTGARSIKSSLEEAVLSARWYVLLNLGKYNKIVLTKETVKDNNDCLIYDVDGNAYNLKDLIKPLEIEQEKVKKIEMGN